MKDVEVKVRDIIVRNLGVEREIVTPTATFMDDLNANSLDVPDLVLSIEEAFGVEITDGEVERLRAVGDLYTLIRKKRQASPAPEIGLPDHCVPTADRSPNFV